MALEPKGAPTEPGRRNSANSIVTLRHRVGLETNLLAQDIGQVAAHGMLLPAEIGSDLGDRGAHGTRQHVDRALVLCN